MDKAAYMQAYVGVVPQPCAFRKGILARCVSCDYMQKVDIAEREAITCKSADRLSRCNILHEHLIHGFSFAQKRLRDDIPLTHAQSMRIQCGGLQGLKYILAESCEVENVDALVDLALQKWETFEQIPYSEIVHVSAQCYKGRHG
ncbi:MAG: hypothetical protein WCI39_12450 [Gallionellaceae bacterium]